MLYALSMLFSMRQIGHLGDGLRVIHHPNVQSAMFLGKRL